MVMINSPPRTRLRSRHACLNCRRKKSRCPSEKPACSSCVRLGQPCTYTEGDPRHSDRLAYLEQKLDLILHDNGQPSPSDQLHEDAFLSDYTGPPEAGEGANRGSQISDSAKKDQSSSSPSQAMEDSFSSLVGLRDPRPETPQSAIAEGIELYFKHFHRQPIWCFERHEIQEHIDASSELAYSLLELTTRLSRPKDLPCYGDIARGKIMLRISTGTVEIETISSLCVLSYSAFIDGDRQLGQFYLGLGFQLCRCAKIDRHSAFLTENTPASRRKKKLFWSLQSLEQFFSDRDGILGAVSDIWRPYFVSDQSTLGFPHDDFLGVAQDGIGSSSSSDIGIWSFAVHFGWVWSKVREYVCECSHNKFTEPWRLDSIYTKILADMTEIENKMPWCHRYEPAKFHERLADEISLHGYYWMPWIKLQFTWHAILTMLNHPFLYIVASQHHPSLAIPNTFWRKSSEQVLLHATWIVRMIDMISEKQVRLVDPFFGHAAAIAATVHLYFCCAADARLQQKSKADFIKCQRFLNSFSSFSGACETVNQSLEKLACIAFENEPMDDGNLPSRIYFNIPLMWCILQFNAPGSGGLSGSAVLHSSLTPTELDEHTEHDSTLEISLPVAPPEVKVDPAGWHNSCLPPYTTTITSKTHSPNKARTRDVLVPPADILNFNTPWLWKDLPQIAGLGAESGFMTEPSTSETFSSWWDFGNL